MRKEWMNPEITELSVKGTEKVEPIILSTFSMDPLYGWRCPCCLAESGYVFKTEKAAREDFRNNHLPNCPKYNSATDSCVIS